jgi:hypothetical protein
MTFDKILKELQHGRVVRRDSWADCFVVFMQIPAFIECERTWNMQSLPTDMKVLLKQQNASINYQDQFIIYDLSNGVATYNNFEGEDVNATDWLVIDPFNYQYE